MGEQTDSAAIGKHIPFCSTSFSFSFLHKEHVARAISNLRPSVLAPCSLLAALSPPVPAFYTFFTFAHRLHHNLTCIPQHINSSLPLQLILNRPPPCRARPFGFAFPRRPCSPGRQIPSRLLYLPPEMLVPLQALSQSRPDIYNAVLSWKVPVTIGFLYASTAIFLNRLNRERGNRPWSISKTRSFYHFVLAHNIFLAVFSALTFVGMIRALAHTWPSRRDLHFLGKFWPGLRTQNGLAGAADALCKLHGPRGFGDAVFLQFRFSHLDYYQLSHPAGLQWQS